MNTTLKQITMSTPLGEEVLDMTEFATNESVVQGLQEVNEKIDIESLAIQTKIDNIDLSSVAKQGENTEATNTAILAEIKAINDLKNIYSVRFEQNQDGDNTYTMVLPLVAGIVGDTIIM